MSRTIEKVDKLTLPVIPLRGIVAFPSMPLNFELRRDISLKACRAAMDEDMYVFLTAQRDISVDAPSGEDLYRTGCIAKIRHTVRSADGTVRVIAEGVLRGTAVSFAEHDGYFSADIISKVVTSDLTYSDVRCEALTREALRALEAMLSYIPSASGEILQNARSIKAPGQLADYIAASVLVRYQDKQQVLECTDPMRRIELLTVTLESEMALVRTEAMIHTRVKEQIDENQREYYLREQLKVIQGELGMDGDDAAVLADRIEKAELSDEVRERLMKEVHRLSKAPFGSPEGTLKLALISRGGKNPRTDSTSLRQNAYLNVITTDFTT